MNWKSLKFSTKGAIIGFFIALITIIISILGLTTCSAGFDCILWLWLIFPTLFFFNILGLLGSNGGLIAILFIHLLLFTLVGYIIGRLIHKIKSKKKN
ncbi:hypothetical protein CL616_01390 [archaeon]|nr:hypothetical protein [archaeon]|tara:strand:- start:1691 stop:1984 length:294 start_codon:yes stop_codon:yes gene_type:complete